VHQFCKIGQHAFTGMGTAVGKDVPAYITVNGSPAEAHGINTEGLRRRGFSPETINLLRKAYKIVYRQSLTVEMALAVLEDLAAEFSEVATFRDSIKASSRGITR